MARTEQPTTINHSIQSNFTSRPSSNLAKDSTQRNDEIKSEFHLREGTYKISSLIDNLGKFGTNNCLNESVKMTLLTRVHIQTNAENESVNSEINETSIEQTNILVFNLGRELLIHEFNERRQTNFNEPLDHRIYKQNHQPTCHDIIQDLQTNILHVLVGFSKGQIQYINMHTKEQKVFNEGSYLDKSKVTCVKWLQNPRTHFIVSYSSGCLYVFDEELNYQRDPTIQPVYSTIRDPTKNYSIFYTKTKTKQTRNPIARWIIGNGSVNEFAFSPDQTLLATVSQDGFLRIFHYEKMELISYMKSYFGGLLCVCWSPDGKYLATGGEDDFLTLFSLESDDHTPRVVCRGHGHTSWLSAIAFERYFSSSFYRIYSVGQDNRLCLWDITEDILNSKSYVSISSSLTSNGCSSSLSTDQLSSTQSSTTKSSLSSLASRLSFVRNSNKVNKSVDDTPDLALITLSNGSIKKSRRKSIASKLPTPSTDETLTNFSLNNSRRTNIDLTRTTFGTNLCPKLTDIQIIEPILTEFIAHERLNGIILSENYFLTSSQDGIIAIWDKPQKNVSQ